IRSVGPLLADVDADLAMVGMDVVVVDDDREDLAAQRETFRLEFRAAGRRRTADHCDLRIVELETQEQRAAIAALHERRTQLVDRDAQVSDLVDVDPRSRGHATGDETGHAYQASVGRQHQLNWSVRMAIVFHAAPSGSAGGTLAPDVWRAT